MQRSAQRVIFPGRPGVIVIFVVLALVGVSLLALFGWAIRALLGPEPERVRLREGEEILLTRWANHAKRLGGSGSLSVTTQRLLFHARKLSFRREPVSIELAYVRDVGTAHWQTHLLVVTDRGHDVFVVDGGADLATLIGRLAAAPENDRQAVHAAWRDAPPA
jgi:hypothetical protein